MELGACKYCGQTYQVEITEDMTDEKLDEEATLKCDCDDAKNFHREQKKKQKVIENIHTLVRPEMPEIAEMLINHIDLILIGAVDNISIKMNSGEKVNVSTTSKGTVKVNKNHKVESTLES